MRFCRRLAPAMNAPHVILSVLHAEVVVIGHASRLALAVPHRAAGRKQQLSGTPAY